MTRLLSQYAALLSLCGALACGSSANPDGAAADAGDAGGNAGASSSSGGGAAVGCAGDTLFCDDFEDPGKSAAAWKNALPANPQFVLPAFGPVTDAHSGARAMLGRARVDNDPVFAFAAHELGVVSRASVTAAAAVRFNAVTGITSFLELTVRRSAGDPEGGRIACSVRSDQVVCFGSDLRRGGETGGFEIGRLVLGAWYLFELEVDVDVDPGLTVRVDNRTVGGRLPLTLSARDSGAGFEVHVQAGASAGEGSGGDGGAENSVDIDDVVVK